MGDVAGGADGVVFGGTGQFFVTVAELAHQGGVGVVEDVEDGGHCCNVRKLERIKMLDFLERFDCVSFLLATLMEDFGYS